MRSPGPCVAPATPSPRRPKGAGSPPLEALPARGCGAATCSPRWRGDIGDDGGHTTPAVSGPTLLSPRRDAAAGAPRGRGGGVRHARLLFGANDNGTGVSGLYVLDTRR